MRLRNIPGADEAIQKHAMVIKQELFEAETGISLKGNWEKVFKNDQKIQIEIGMGKGKFLMEMAKQNPQINYVGIERYSSVLLRATEKFDTEEYRNLKNIRFLCMDAGELPQIFRPGEVDKIYLNFSDPWPKARHARRRLTSEPFLNCYSQILKEEGMLEFKTDNTGLFEFSLEQIRESNAWSLQSYTYDLHGDPAKNAGNCMTEYEEKFSVQGNPIHKMTAILRKAAPVGIE